MNYDRILNVGGGNMNYDRILLELIDRVSVLETEVAKLTVNKESAPARLPLQLEKTAVNISRSYQGANRKDTSRYLFKNRTYGKNRLVLAVVQAYFAENPNISASELVLTFDSRIQGSLGVVRGLDELEQTYPDYQRRFFVHTVTGDCVVCNQWGKFNIDAFISRAKELGFDIELV